MASKNWVVRDGRLFFILPPVREGKREMLATPRAVLGNERKEVVVYFQESPTIVLQVVDRKPVREKEVKNLILILQEFICEFEGERVVFEFEVSSRLTPARQAELDAARERDRLAAIERERATEQRERELETAKERVRAKLVSAIRPAAEAMTFSHHNKLWQRDDRRIGFVRKLLALACELRDERGRFLAGIADLPGFEIEAVRLQLWSICEELRAVKKADWLAAHPT